MRKIRSVCNLCPSACGVIVHAQNGEPYSITGDPASPLSAGFLCEKGKATLEYVRHKDRILFPLKRKGKRGEGKWQRISWDEALETVATEMNRVKSNLGPEYVIFLRGAAKGLADILLTRLANAFGSSNITSMGFVCFIPRVYAYNATFGSFLYPDYDYPPSTIVLWGINPAATYPLLYRKIVSAKEKGSKIIVIDPRPSESCSLADIWVKPRPGSDIILVLNFLHEIVKRKLYDTEFIQTWSYGFDRLAKEIEPYDPSHTESYTGVSESEVREFVRLYLAHRPSAIQEGNALEQTYHAFQTLRAIYILEAITGNIGIPGGKVRWKNPRVVENYGAGFTLRNLISPEERKKRLGVEFVAPFVHYALPQAIVKGLTEEVPYKPRVAFLMGGNVLLTWPDSKKVLDSLKALDFLCVVDMFMSPTAMLADIILPAATYLEYDSVLMPPDFTYVACAQVKVTDIGDAKSDLFIINELGKRLGLREYFFSDESELLDVVLKDDGITFEELKRIGVLLGTKDYRFYQHEGFRTPSGKVELFSESLEKSGHPPLPSLDWQIFEQSQQHKFFLTSYKPLTFRHTSFRNVKSLRERHPDPLVQIRAEVAHMLGIKEGDWVFVETEKGRVKARTNLVIDLRKDTVVLEHGWWFPEEGWESFLELNINTLTTTEGAFCPETGTPQLRGRPCTVYKAR